MLKLLGAILLIGGATGMGMGAASRWRERLGLLETLRKMMSLLKGEILYANAPLEEAFYQVGKRSKGPLGELFCRISGRIETQRGEPFFDMWREEVDRLPARLPLSQEDKQALKSFGEHLGYLDSEMQERTILLYLEQLDLAIDYLRENRREKERLYTCLGVMGGLFLTIILY
ncbi:MAG: stage III sporulation protein AB [Lachnospiraceae bacterium]